MPEEANMSERVFHPHELGTHFEIKIWIVENSMGVVTGYFEYTPETGHRRIHYILTGQCLTCYTEIPEEIKDAIFKGILKMSH